MDSHHLGRSAGPVTTFKRNDGMLGHGNSGKSKDQRAIESNRSEVLFFKPPMIPKFQYSIVPDGLRRSHVA